MSNKANEIHKTFIIDCPRCRAKVAAIEEGRALNSGTYEDGEPYGTLLQVGCCPHCHTLLAGECEQTGFAGYNSEYDQWSNVIRVHPKPPKVFTSNRIPRVVKSSIAQAEGALQGNAPDAACVMLGRALEAICRHLLEVQEKTESNKSDQNDNSAKGKSKGVDNKSVQKKETPKKKIMLDAGLKALKEKGLIDPRLYEWSQQLKAFRNLSAHPDEEFSASREDVDDLLTFVYAFTEYTYDLADRYEEFLDRQAFKKSKATKLMKK